MRENEMKLKEIDTIDTTWKYHKRISQPCSLVCRYNKKVLYEWIPQPCSLVYTYNIKVLYEYLSLVASALSCRPSSALLDQPWAQNMIITFSSHWESVFQKQSSLRNLSQSSIDFANKANFSLSFNSFSRSHLGAIGGWTPVASSPPVLWRGKCSIFGCLSLCSSSHHLWL